MGRMRVTQHNGRVRKSGQPYSPKHNDRNFDVSKADNIDADRVARNMYWSCVSDGWYSARDKEQPSFEDVERDFYEAHFMPMYQASRKRSEDRGQLKRVKPFDEWRKARQFVPEESYLQIGSVDDGTVDADMFVQCVAEYLEVMDGWNTQHGEPFTVLDIALHVDEAVPQLHIRRVWHSTDPVTGIDEIGQAKALERAGVEPPDPSAPISAKNNRKQTYDAYMREQWIAICEAHGLDIERVPERGRPHNQTKEEHIRGKQKARTKDLDSREAAVTAREQDAARTKAVLDRRETAVIAKEQQAQGVKEAADEYARKVKRKANTDAEKIAEKAAQDAQATRQTAALDARQTRQDARSEAASLKQSGYEDGYDEGEAEAKKTVIEDFKRSALAKLLGDRIERDVRDALEAGGLSDDLVKLLPGE